MVFSSITANYHYAIAVFNIDPVIGHRPPSERCTQGSHSGRMTQPGAMLKISYSQSTSKLCEQICLFIVDGSTAIPANSFGMIDNASFLIFVSPVLIPCFLDISGNFVYRPIPGYFLPIRGIWRTIRHPVQTAFIIGYLNKSCAFATQRSLVNRMVRVPFNIYRFAIFIRGYDCSTTHATITTNGGFFANSFS